MFSTSSTSTSTSSSYSLLPLLYTEFYKASQDGRPVVRSVFFEFPNEPLAEHVSTQFLWGDAVMIMPVVERGVTELSVYYPAGRWYRYADGHLLSESHPLGRHQQLQLQLTEIGVAVRGGRVLATQQPEVTTVLTRRHPFRLLVALDADQRAAGDLYWDDGETVDPILVGDYNYVKFTFDGVSEPAPNRLCLVACAP